jgi:hypothetical protein
LKKRTKKLLFLSSFYDFGHGFGARTPHRAWAVRGFREPRGVAYDKEDS